MSAGVVPELLRGPFAGGKMLSKGTSPVPLFADVQVLSSRCPPAKSP